jgi:proteasome lid subunit RPN8/RPN11
MKVFILPAVHAEIMHYVRSSKVEISGLGRIEKDSEGNLVVTKVYLPKQVNGPTSTDIDQEDVSRILFESRADKGALNFWWHSHVDMGAFWSGTDMATIKQFGGKGWLLASVFNKRGEYQTALYRAGDDFFPEVFLDKIETRFEYIPTKDQKDAWDAEMTARCSTQSYQTTYYQGRQTYAPGLWDDEDYYSPKIYSQGAQKDTSKRPTIVRLSSVPFMSMAKKIKSIIALSLPWSTLTSSQRSIFIDMVSMIYYDVGTPPLAQDIFKEMSSDQLLYDAHMMDFMESLAEYYDVSLQEAWEKYGPDEVTQIAMNDYVEKDNEALAGAMALAEAVESTKKGN